MKYLLLALLLAGCTSAIKQDSPGAQLTIFAVEGLGYGDYVTNGLIAPLIADHEFNLIRISWGDECPKEFPDGRLAAVGHSLGGPHVLECVKASGREFELVVTLDARVFGQPYSAPKLSKRTVNFYQSSLIFPGYPVQGAIENKVSVGHTEIPYLPAVRAEFEKLFK
ncbi:hypothetical protein UFOVP558_22 [uncultured Caudovirales phage]|uniref:Alpha/beta hydrolase n=1 Tax=uncultured Caudovirales phage TaxID=2100421 RepID=A0A6J5MSD8_9CAUD|nr:hypothetical protein UFOVP558_22 [uncultured Caudovirales phage]